MTWKILFGCTDIPKHTKTLSLPWITMHDIKPTKEASGRGIISGGAESANIDNYYVS